MRGAGAPRGSDGTDREGVGRSADRSRGNAERGEPRQPSEYRPGRQAAKARDFDSRIRGFESRPGFQFPATCSAASFPPHVRRHPLADDRRRPRCSRVLQPLARPGTPMASTPGSCSLPVRPPRSGCRQRIGGDRSTRPAALT